MVEQSTKSTGSKALRNPWNEWRITYKAGVQTIQLGQLIWDSFFTEKEQQLLGGDFVKAYEAAPPPHKRGRTIGMVVRVRKCSEERAALEAAKWAQLISPPHYEIVDRELRKAEGLKPLRGVLRRRKYSDEDVEDRIKIACQTRDLVVVTGPGTQYIYWKTNAVTSDGFHAPACWDFFLALVSAGRSGIDHTDLEKTPNAFKCVRTRLKKYLPPVLNSSIITVARRYKLNLSKDQHAVIQVDVGDKPDDPRLDPTPEEIEMRKEQERKMRQ